MDLLTKSKIHKAQELMTELWGDCEREQKDAHKLNAWRAIVAASQGRYRQGAPAEYERWGCVEDNLQRIVIPWGHLVGCAQRDLTIASSSGGGYLAFSKTTPLALPLIGSGLGRAGANFIRGVMQDSISPKITTKPAITWQASESTSLSADTSMTLGQVTAQPKRGGISLKASRQISLQAQNFDRTVERLLIQLGNDAVDLGGLNGSGASGQPAGLLNNGNIQAVSGAAMNVSGLASMEENAVQNDADDERLTWIASTDTRRILRGRELTAAGGSIWPGSTLLGHPAIVTSKMPAVSLLVGDFHNVDVLLFGEGVEVLVDPFSNFASGAITFQLSVAMDLVVNYPAAFRKSTTVS